jgi:hypothetical protein
VSDDTKFCVARQIIILCVNRPLGQNIPFFNKTQIGEALQ